MDVFEFIFWLNVFFVKENFFFFIRNLFGGKEVNFKKNIFYVVVYRFFKNFFIMFLKKDVFFDKIDNLFFF